MQEKTRAILFGRPKKKKSDDHPLSRRDIISLMFKVAFLEAMALSIILPSVTSTGEFVTGCLSNVCSDVQTQTTTINIPACPVINCNAQSAMKDIFFPKAFSSTPKVETTISNSAELGIDERSWTVLASGSATTWTAQPAGVTELFGNTAHEWPMLWFTDDNLTCSLVVDVINPGFAGSVLRVQSSPDAVTWTNFQSSPNGDVPISSAGIQTNTYSAAGNGGLGSSNLGGPFYRVVGQGGNGIVSPSFGNIYFECWWNTIFLQAYVLTITTTDFFLGVSILMPSSSNPQPVTVTWTACTIGC